MPLRAVGRPATVEQQIPSRMSGTVSAPKRGGRHTPIERNKPEVAKGAILNVDPRIGTEKEIWVLDR